MKKYKNVKAIKARVCCGYVRNFNGDYAPYCIGVHVPFKNPHCDGYKCKCTEYKYNRKEGKLV